MSLEGILYRDWLLGSHPVICRGIARRVRRVRERAGTPALTVARYAFTALRVAWTGLAQERRPASTSVA